MSWAIGFDSHWQRDIGYGVPAYCDHPKCHAEIDRGLGCVCGGQPYGGEKGCGLYFCGEHLWSPGQLCNRCWRRKRPPYQPKPEHPRWLHHKETDPSWAEWRAERQASSERP